ncbi:hypothetical protein QE152_g7686 [Popillia japonica]|uniref:Transposase n=1 Tax=Popillia japonica TaxID=7064 RepID=A0AAW1MDV8_POPJA
MYKERKHVTLQSLKDQLKTKEIVSLSRQSLATLLKDIGFKFRKEDNRRALVERHYVALMRSVFLKKYMDNLSSSTPRPVVFLDETWIYSKGNKGKSWQDDSVKSVRKPEGYDVVIEKQLNDTPESDTRISVNEQFQMPSQLSPEKDHEKNDIDLDLPPLKIEVDEEYNPLGNSTGRRIVDLAPMDRVGIQEFGRAKRAVF